MTPLYNYKDFEVSYPPTEYDRVQGLVTIPEGYEYEGPFDPTFDPLQMAMEADWLADKDIKNMDRLFNTQLPVEIVHPESFDPETSTVYENIEPFDDPAVTRRVRKPYEYFSAVEELHKMFHRALLHHAAHMERLHSLRRIRKEAKKADEEFWMGAVSQNKLMSRSKKHMPHYAGVKKKAKKALRSYYLATEEWRAGLEVEMELVAPEIGRWQRECWKILEELRKKVVPLCQVEEGLMERKRIRWDPKDEIRSRVMKSDSRLRKEVQEDYWERKEAMWSRAVRGEGHPLREVEIVEEEEEAEEADAGGGAEGEEAAGQPEVEVAVEVEEPRRVLRSGRHR